MTLADQTGTQLLPVCLLGRDWCETAHSVGRLSDAQYYESIEIVV